MGGYVFKDYVDYLRWISFYEQISAVVNLSPTNILEIGLGSRIVYAVLRETGFKITGFDNDKELKPDILGDIKDVRSLFREDQFDCVCCFQVLEHLPFEDFELIMKNLGKISSRHVVISLPYAGFTFGAEIRLSRIGERKLDLTFRIPRFWNKHKYDGMHYWEIGKIGYPLSKIKNILSKYFSTIKIIPMRPNKDCLTFILNKK